MFNSTKYSFNKKSKVSPTPMLRTSYLLFVLFGIFERIFFPVFWVFGSYELCSYFSLEKINNLIIDIHTVEIWQGQWQWSYFHYIYHDDTRLTYNCAQLWQWPWSWLPSGYIQLNPKASFSSLASFSTPLQQPGTDWLCLNNSPSTLSTSMGKSHIMNTFLWRILEFCL